MLHQLFLPFPAGLNDCVSGLKWVHGHADSLGIDPGRIVVAGESGGGNSTLAVGMKLQQDGDLGLIQGLYAMCPFIAGELAAAGESLLQRERGNRHLRARQPQHHGLRDRRLQGPHLLAGPGWQSPTMSGACRRW